MSTFIHPSAEVSSAARIGDETRIWSLSQIREGAVIGAECNIGRNVYVDFDVSIGDRVKIQNNASIYNGVTLESGVFIGPHVCFCNDVYPRAITPTGALKTADDWEVGPTLVRYGASVGAGSIIVPNITIGRYALVGAGSVVTRDVPDHALVFGNPARPHGYVCICGRLLEGLTETPENGEFPRCAICQQELAAGTSTATQAPERTATEAQER